MGSPVVHFEIMGPDGSALARFYSDLFGGGKVIMPPTQVAENTKVAMFMDPQGNAFGMYEGM